jgi:quinohemoprotein ethanol dehydrogenase
MKIRAINLRHWAGLVVVLCLALGAVAAWSAASPSGPAQVDGARLRAADSDPGNWLSVGRGWDESHYSPLDQINLNNVSQLGLAWYADIDIDRGVEATPLVIDGVLYNITPWNVTTAFDATNGKILWRYDPQVPRKFGGLACCDIVTRGVAAWKGKIYIATLDGRLIALNAKTGEPIWSVNTFDPVWPYTITGAPRVYDGVVVIGNGGAELAARGYVNAYDAETGKKVWRFNIVPPNPADGPMTDAEKVAAKTWTGEWWKMGGGGTAWDAFAYDPKLHLLYIGTGNGGPWVRKIRSPGGGDNLYIASIVALDVRTGKYVWHYQQTPGEEWDYTSTQPIILADLKINGKMRQVLMQAPKNGFFYILDRKTGELLSAEPFVDGITWAKSIDMKTGRPIENPEARYSDKPVLISPGAAGAHNWHPMAYSPKTGLVYIPTLHSSLAYQQDMNFQLKPGERSQLGIVVAGAPYEEERKALSKIATDTTKAWLMAWDPVAHKEVWRVPYRRRGSGGVLATAGDLVFQGTIDTTFAAYNAKTGDKVWDMPVQQVPIAGAMTYTVNGVQYVAINAGWGGGLAHGPGANDSDLKLSRVARLLVFKLGGKATLPPIQLARDGGIVIGAPPADTASPAQIAKGAKLFADNCAACHGAEARGGVKDLRMMTAKTHAEFFDIVLKGARQERGMINFSGVLNQADAEAIHAYLIHRANEDWNGKEIK